MLASAQIEDLMILAASLDRPALVNQFHQYPGKFPVDFTDEFLERTSLDKLRHIFVAMCVQNQRLPDSFLHAA
jgi:hypothetical protein